MRMYTLVVAIAGTFGLMACGDDEPSPTAPTPVTPAQPTVSSLSLRSDGETTLSVGETLTVTACARYSDGSENCSIPVAWQSLQPEVASVEAGTVTAVAVGQATIQASYQSRTATLQITVGGRGTNICVRPGSPGHHRRGRHWPLPREPHRRRQPTAADRRRNLVSRIRRAAQPGGGPLAVHRRRCR